MLIRQILEHKKGIKAVKYNKKPKAHTPAEERKVIGPDAPKKKEEVAEGAEKRCMQCGMKNCSCPGDSCKCKPIAGWIPGKGFKKAVDEGSVAKKPQPYNEPGWAKNLPKEKLDAIAGPRYKKDKKEQGVEEGFGEKYAEQLAQQIFDQHPDLNDEDDVLKAGYAIAKQELGHRARGIFRDDDFPGDLISAYNWVKEEDDYYGLPNRDGSNEGVAEAGMYRRSGSRSAYDRDYASSVSSMGRPERDMSDESNLLYIYKDGRVMKRMVSNTVEREARAEGFRDTPEQALKMHGIIRSKFKPGKWVQKQGDQWMEVFPFGKPDDIAETATPGATSAGNVATLGMNPKLSPGPARGKKSYTGTPGKSGTKAPPQPKVNQPKTKHGTAVNALDMKSNIFGGGKAIKRK